MISAKEARMYTKRCKENQLTELEIVQQVIIRAMFQGENKVYIEPAISTFSKNVLTQFGYWFENDEQAKRMLRTIITWDNQEE